jgi:hypothetical protein
MYLFQQPTTYPDTVTEDMGIVMLIAGFLIVAVALYLIFTGKIRIEGRKRK